LNLFLNKRGEEKNQGAGAVGGRGGVGSKRLGWGSIYFIPEDFEDRCRVGTAGGKRERWWQGKGVQGDPPGNNAKKKN